VPEIAADLADKLDPVWKALSDPTRRAILDFLRNRTRTTTEIVEAFPRLSRFGVMKHLEVLRQAQLVHTREAGRMRVNSLNVVPIRQIYERWVGPFQELWSGDLLRIKEMAEEESPKKQKSLRRRKNIRRPLAKTAGPLRNKKG
jgi:DNA-binding transcriptional ArsR family regulator